MEALRASPCAGACRDHRLDEEVGRATKEAEEAREEATRFAKQAGPLRWPPPSEQRTPGLPAPAPAPAPAPDGGSAEAL